MTTWANIARFEGYRTSPEFPINIEGDGALTQVKWEAIIPDGTSVEVYTNISFNNGVSWEGWKKAYQNGSIPDIHSNTPLDNALIKYRVFLRTEDENITPVFHNITFFFEPVIEFINEGDGIVRPEIWIKKIGNGDFSLINTSNGNDEFKFVNLIDGETVYVNNENQDIETDLYNTYRYANFNDNFLEIPHGVNIFKVIGNAEITFRYQYILLQ